MKISKTPYKGWLSVFLSLTLATTFSLTSLAASETGDSIGEELTDSLIVSQAPTGTLTTHGPVLVNGIEAKTGATITDGSVIQTRTGGHAMIELGALGRVELDPITAITLTMPGGNSIHASLVKCGQGVTLTLPAGVPGTVKIIDMADIGVLRTDHEVDVRVYRGQAVVKYGQGKEKTLKPGDHKEFDNAIEVVATGDTIFKVYCLEDNYPILLLGLGALAAISIPVAVVGEGPVAPVVSPAIP
jgi:hypothetical protein